MTAGCIAYSTVAAGFPAWSIGFFAGLLVTIGGFSFVAANSPHSRPAHFWESNRNKLILSLLWSAPVLVLIASTGEWRALAGSMEEYFAFIVLLFSLYCIAGGVYFSGDLRATPGVNTLILALGALLSNVVGTTGASMLLIRPMLRTNSERKRTAHIPVFFIFVVSNLGGCLLPIGDPPLFLGYLRGVPFFWTLKLLAPWLVAVGTVLLIFWLWDRRSYARESLADITRDIENIQPLQIHGKRLLLLLAGVLAAVVVLTPGRIAALGWAHSPLVFAREYVLLALAGASFLLSPSHSEFRRKNNFTFGPILEVAALFIGIFIAMIPALAILRGRGGELGLSTPAHFFWASGSLSSVLDNAPTYLTFLSVAQSLTAASPEAFPASPGLAALAVNARLLAAISLGSVFMGALTYIGNGPNFMVRAIAAEWGYKVPDFFSYAWRYSLPVLLPVFLLITFLFLR